MSAYDQMMKSIISGIKCDDRKNIVAWTRTHRLYLPSAVFNANEDVIIEKSVPDENDHDKATIAYTKKYARRLENE